MTHMLSDGRPLDDMQPQDIAREFAELLGTFAQFIAGGGPTTEDHRAQYVDQLRRAKTLMHVWADFGKWPQSLRDQVQLLELRQLLTTAAKDHEHQLAANCPACRADKRLREIGRALLGKRS